jgi:hypothetical protein
MKALLAIVALLFSQPAFSQHLDFKVLRGSCAGAPDDFSELTKIQSSWRPGGELEVSIWDTETEEERVLDGSGSLDTSRPGVIRLIYQSKVTSLPPDAPVVMCENFVRIKFLITGLKKSNYEITIEKSHPLFSSSIQG